MTIPKRIIEKAIEGGYPEYTYCENFDMYESSGSYCESTVALDPLFWSALGKALGWDEYIGREKNVRLKRTEEEYSKMWRTMALRFYDRILTGGDTEKFWEELMPSV